jgi:hypothetical protein
MRWSARGAATLLESERDIEIVGEAGSAEQALARIPAANPLLIP